MAYEPTNDFNTAYDAVKGRIARNFAGQRANLNQELATRGVQTSGVTAIPSGRLGAAEAGQQSDEAGRFALDQAHVGIDDRRAAEEFARQKQLAELGWNRQDAVSRRMADSQLQAAVIGGSLGAVGGWARGK